MSCFFEWDVLAPGDIRVRIARLGSFTRISMPYEESAEAGLAHLYEHMLLRANAPVLRELESRGGSYNAFTSENEVAFYFISPQVHLDVDLAAFFRAEFTCEELEIERATILEELAMTPGENGRTTRLLGSVADITGFTLESLLAFAAKLGEEQLKVTYVDIPRASDLSHRAVQLSINHFASHPCAEVRNGSLEFSEDANGGLAEFLLHIAQVGAPLSLPIDVGLGAGKQPLTETDLKFLNRFKPNLWFRYQLHLEEVATLDAEFTRFLRAVGTSIDVKHAFLEVPWEAELRCV